MLHLRLPVESFLVLLSFVFPLHWVFLHNCKEINVYDSYSSLSLFTQLQRDACIWQLLFTESFYTTAKRYMYMTVTLHWVFLHNCKEIHAYDSYSSLSLFTQLQKDTCTSIWQLLFTESFYTTAKNTCIWQLRPKIYPRNMEFNQKSENSWLEKTSTLQSTVDSYLI